MKKIFLVFGILLFAYLAFSCTYIILKEPGLQHTKDFHIHDTWFVVAGWQLLIAGLASMLLALALFYSLVKHKALEKQ